MKTFRVVFTACLFAIMVSVLSPVSYAETGKSDQKIEFNFVDVDIPSIIKFISEITGKNFIFDERIKGKITIIAPTKLSVEESFSLFTSVLDLKGFTIIPSGTKAYKILPSSLARQKGKFFSDEKAPVDETFITRLLPVQYIKANEALKFLKPVISRSGHISAFGPGNLLLIVDSALNIDKIISILKGIDQPPVFQEPASIHVYPLEHADATELAKVLEGIIKNARTAKKKKIPVAQTPFSEVIITSDKATNSLIIIASPTNFKAVTRVIKTLDKRRRQVFVEAMIVEASIDKLKALGTKWRAAVSHSDQPVAIGGFGTIDAFGIQDILNGLTGFSVGGMGNFLDVPLTTINSDGSFSTSTLTVPGFAALFDLTDFQDAINILSTPQILTSDNEEAEIVVGENVPFISKRERDITTTNTVLSSIERQDVGITLKITPQITAGDYVKLDLYQEISSVKEGTENVTIAIGPTTTKRATKTSIVVRDGQTVVIGGLMQEKEEENIVKTPFFGDLPIFGWLFKHKRISKEKTNLLIFITPYIVKDFAQLSVITNKKHKTFAMREKYYMEGELLVKFNEGVSNDKALEILSQKGASIIKYIEDIRLYHVQLKSEQNVEDAIKEFSAEPDILYVEPNFKIKIRNKTPSLPDNPAPAPESQEDELFLQD